jgi:hypothetical protein
MIASAQLSQRALPFDTARFRVTGDVALVLELIQHVDEPVPGVSIMERDGRGVVTISAQQTRVLVGALCQLPSVQIDQV